MIHFNFGKYKQDRASHRLRAYHPAMALRALGHESKLAGKDIPFVKNDIVIFSKDCRIEVMKATKAVGAIVGFDICDNKWGEEDHDNRYIELCAIADFITANTDAMRQVILKETGRDSYVYHDSIDRELEPVRNNIHSPIQLVWYGGSASVKYIGLRNLQESLLASGIKYQLHLIVDNADRLSSKFKKRFLKNNVEGFSTDNMIFHNWGWEAQGELVRLSDIAMLPTVNASDFSDHRLSTKSPNRIVDALAQGRFVITTPTLSNVDLIPFCWSGDPIAGVLWYQKNFEEAQQKVKDGQQYISVRYSALHAAKQLINIASLIKEKHGI